jgi:hypothetical protein
MKLAKLLAFVVALTAVAGAQVSAPNVILSYEQRGKTQEVHELELRVDGYVVHAATAERKGSSESDANRRMRAV